MHKLTSVLTLILMTVPGPTAHAEELSLSDVIRSAWQASPQLKAQGELTSLAESDRWHRFLPNEPQATLANTDDDTSNAYGVQLVVPFPGKPFAMSKQDRARAFQARREVQARKYDLAKMVAQAYIDCAAAQASVDLQRQNSGDLETVFKSLRALYESGHSTQAEKIGAELQARQAQLDLVSAQDREAIACTKFSHLLQTQGTEPAPAARLQLPDDLDEKIVGELGNLTADQARSEGSVEVASATAAVAGWSQLPDFTVGATRNHYLYLPGSPRQKEWTTTFSIAVTLPILFPFSEHTEARRQRQQADLDRNAAAVALVNANSDQSDGRREYQRSKNRLRELRAKDLALAQALVESTASAYRAGKLGFAELVLSRKTLNDLRSQDIQLRTSIIGARLRCLNNCNGGST